MMTAYLTSEMCQDLRAELTGKTAEGHLALAASLLAGTFERSGPWVPAEYHWVAPSAEAAARAHAHATLALAMLAADHGQQVSVGAIEIRSAVPR